MSNWLAQKFTPWWLLALILCWPIIEIGMIVHQSRPSVEATMWAVGYLMDCKQNRACLPSKFEAIAGSIAYSSGQSAIASRQLKEAADQAISLLKNANAGAAPILANLSETTRRVNTEVLPRINGFLDATKASLAIVDSLRQDLDSLTTSTNADLASLKTALDNLALLLASLDAAVKENSPKVAEILDATVKAEGDVDALLADPHVKSTLAHVDGISDSTDKIFKQMATKVGILKTILNVMLGVVKVNFYAPRF